MQKEDGFSSNAFDERKAFFVSFFLKALKSIVCKLESPLVAIYWSCNSKKYFKCQCLEFMDFMLLCKSSHIYSDSGPVKVNQKMTVFGSEILVWSSEIFMVEPK